jgi:TPP-dependent pyruvate/acetoin dehydrogenase alpha subunit
VSHIRVDTPAIGAAATSANLRDLYRRMLLIRGFEDSCLRLYTQGHIHGTTHLYSGQEAVSVGVASQLRDSDRVAATYRGHGISLALGISPESLFAELFGRASGVCGGRAGSMNIVSPEHGLIGCFGIVGGSIAAATGAALGLRERGAVAVAFFGDGAANQAYFHECLNFAQVLHLPAVYVCENNLYGEFTPMEQVTAGEIAARPRSLGMPTSTVDGNDVITVQDAAAEAIDRARSGRGPAFVEALTYRYGGHSRSDPGRYRKPGELEHWKQRDPLLLAAQRLRAENGLSQSDLDDIASGVAAELREAETRALVAPFPSALDAHEFKEESH